EPHVLRALVAPTTVFVHAVSTARVCASPASFRLTSEARPIRLGGFWPSERSQTRRFPKGFRLSERRVKRPGFGTHFRARFGVQPASPGTRPSQGVMKFKRL